MIIVIVIINNDNTSNRAAAAFACPRILLLFCVMYADFRIVIQAKGEPLAKQALHLSTIQTLSACPMCDMSPTDISYNIWDEDWGIKVGV